MVIDMLVQPMLYGEICTPGDEPDGFGFWSREFGMGHMGPMDWDELQVEMDVCDVQKSLLMPLDPRVSSAAGELERAFTELGAKGLCLHPAKQGFDPDDAVAEPLYELCERYNKPVVFHAGMSWEPGAELSRSNPLAFEHTIATHPNVRFSLTHFGWPWVRETVAMLLKYPNCYTDTSITYIDSPEEMMQRLFTVDMGPLWYERALSHQVMFASNTPRFRAFKLKRALDTVPMRDDARERLYWGNALRFLEGDE